MFRSVDLADAQVLYDSEFFARDQADELFATLEREIEWEQRSIKIFGRDLPQPRLTAWYGEMGYTYSGLHWDAKEWPKTLMVVKIAVEAHTGEVFNSVLANLYRNGQDSVGWHSDDEPELGRDPVIASVSLGAERTFQMKRKSGTEEWKILLAHGSLLMMKGPTQHFWKHTLPKDKRIQRPRRSTDGGRSEDQVMGAFARKQSGHPGERTRGPRRLRLAMRGWFHPRIQPAPRRPAARRATAPRAVCHDAVRASRAAGAGGSRRRGAPDFRPPGPGWRR